METTKKRNQDGSITQTNYMLDDVIEAFDRHAESMDVPFGVKDELIKEMTIQKIEYGRTCISQLLSHIEHPLQGVRDYYIILDKMLQIKIREVGGNPKSISISI